MIWRTRVRRHSLGSLDAHGHEGRSVGRRRAEPSAPFQNLPAQAAPGNLVRHGRSSTFELHLGVALDGHGHDGRTLPVPRWSRPHRSQLEVFLFRASWSNRRTHEQAHRSEQPRYRSSVPAQTHGGSVVRVPVKRIVAGLTHRDEYCAEACRRLGRHAEQGNGVALRTGSSGARCRPWRSWATASASRGCGRRR
jgi:hypothetical protein